MKNLKHIRIILSIVFFIEAAAFVALATNAPSHTAIAMKVQIIPSMITMSMGATLLWILVTLACGRVYCSTVCPIGTLQDIFTFIREKIFHCPMIHSYAPQRKIRYGILTVYAAVTIVGASFGALLEPWNEFQGMIGAVSTHDTGIFIQLAADTTLGFMFAIGMLLLFVVYAIITGRDFCNHVCPLGTAMGLIASRAVLHIDIDPDRCNSCMKCEDGCKASCISVKDRIVDNNRCVRCFDCISSCERDAIRLQINRNGVISPMMRRTKSATSI